jgi:hypothetical protein
MLKLLKFGFGNSKLQRGEVIFDLPAGHTCPFALNCLSRADRKTGLIKDGEQTQFRCYAASLENMRPNVRNAHWHNFDLLKGKTLGEMIKIIDNSLPHALLYRIHSSGDFFKQSYFDAWLAIAKRYPNRIFYAYTKALPFWLLRKDDIPSNFKLTASKGGKHDAMIQEHGLKFAQVVLSPGEAKRLKLKTDKTDELAWKQDKSFALLIHGTQPAGSEAGKAWYKLRKSGLSGYGS